MIRVIVFDLPGVLVEPAHISTGLRIGVGRVMAARWGGEPSAWEAAQAQVLSDWDSYYTDLDLTGDEALAHLWEGTYRTTRALFRLTGTPEPPHETLVTFSRELPALALESTNALYPEVPGVCRALTEAGYTLGAAALLLTGQIDALLAPLTGLFSGPRVGADRAETHLRDARYYAGLARRAGVEPDACLVVGQAARDLRAAKAAGLDALLIDRLAAPERTLPANVKRDLSGVPDYLKGR